MTILKTSLLLLVATAAAYSASCSDDPDADNPGTTGSTSGGPAGPTSTGAGGGATTGTGAGGTGGAGGGSCADVAPRPVVDLTGPVTGDLALSADNDYLMKGLIFVEAPATLTIPPGTRLLGDKASMATLVIKPGAKIIAEGTECEPIVFTSQAPPGDRAAGDWGGVIVLGNAPINVPGGTAQVEGILGGTYGGANPADTSGRIRYVRIEYSGILLSPDNEVNGLTLAGVGSGTEIDYVQVRHTLDDCFEFFGGTVNAKHLVCTYNQDDGFDWDFGYGGKLQFLALQQDPNVADDTNGFEGDNDAAGSLNAPVSEPTIYNATLCGKNVDVDKQQYGMLLRRSTRAHLKNVIATGFEAGIDIRDGNTDIDLTHSIFFGNVTENIAYPEPDPAGAGVLKDDDGGFDEATWFLEAGSMNSAVDPMIPGCFTVGAPDFRPSATITTNAATPPDDGFFDPAAAYIGAFAAEDTWIKGNWVKYDLN